MPKLIYKGLEVGGVSNEAIQCHFDNTGSNITSDNVEAALKELDSKTARLIQVTPEEYEALAPEEKARGLYTIIDDKLSADGINPVQNKVIANAINTLNSNLSNYLPKFKTGMMTGTTNGNGYIEANIPLTSKFIFSAITIDNGYNCIPTRVDGDVYWFYVFGTSSGYVVPFTNRTFTIKYYYYDL